MIRLLPKVFTSTAKALLIAAGMGLGLLKGLRLLDGLADRSAAMEALEQRLDDMQLQIAALQARDEHLQTGLDRASTKDEISAALEKAFERVQGGVDTRFEDQARSVEALREMVSQTDEMLERLLDRLESMRNDAKLEQVGS